ncbi:MAG TPA: M56 family metallopeptidase [Acidobacteriaceae bacterium]|nr:M56 family metallopeptidase [Acidobacteriaceae bacterium]
MLIFILEAALRSIIMAAAVWAVIRLLRVQAVIAQKVAWALVLAAAALMPLVMHSPWLAANRAVRVPVEGLTVRQLAHAAMSRMTTAAAVTPKTYLVAQSSPLAEKPPTTAHAVTGASAPRRQAFVLHDGPAQKAAEGKSASANASRVPTSRVIDLPMVPVELSVKLPAVLPVRVSFWTASRIRLAVILLYAMVVGALLLRTLFGVAVALRLLGRSRRVQFFSGTGQAMRVRSSRDLATPVTIGSTILLPADYADWDAEKLRVVLAHEFSHVRQLDFYLQLAAAVHAAIFWFSPLGWWLKRKLSDLGEALSDRAGMAEAEDAASYAQILLEFAAAPHRAPLAGVAMARTSNLSSRMERILNHRRFQLAFLGGRRHAILAAALVPVALIAAVAGFRIVPAVHAASAKSQQATALSLHRTAHSADISSDQKNSAVLAQTTLSQNLQSSDAVATTVIRGELAQAVSPSSAPAPAVAPLAPVAPVAPEPDVIAPAAPESVAAVESENEQENENDQDSNSEAQRTRGSRHLFINHSGDGDESFTIVHQDGKGVHSHTVNVNGNGDEIDRIEKKLNLHGNYIWFERGGKSYVITDPEILAQADAMFREDPALKQQQKAIEVKQKVLEKQMKEFDSQKVKINVDTPEFKKQMADLNQQIAKLQSAEFKKSMDEINKQVNAEVLSKLQQQMGNIQEQIGQLQGQIGEQMGRFGEQQGRLGEQMGRLGEEMGRIGEEQGRHAEEASRKMQSVFDQALHNGKAKPVE